MAGNEGEGGHFGHQHWVRFMSGTTAGEGDAGWTCVPEAKEKRGTHNRVLNDPE